MNDPIAKRLLQNAVDSVELGCEDFVSQKVIHVDMCLQQPSLNMSC